MLNCIFQCFSEHLQYFCLYCYIGNSYTIVIDFKVKVQSNEYETKKNILILTENAMKKKS